MSRRGPELLAIARGPYFRALAIQAVTHCRQVIHRGAANLQMPNEGRFSSASGVRKGDFIQVQKARDAARAAVKSRYLAKEIDFAVWNRLANVTIPSAA